jgi:hypothetical protein
MAIQKSPHPQSEENTNPARADLEPDELEQNAGTGPDAELYQNMDGAETAGTRTPKREPPRGQGTAVEPASAAYEGTLASRTPHGETQGITNRSLDEESERQQRVVEDRPDAQAGVNHAK